MKKVQNQLLGFQISLIQYTYLQQSPLLKQMKTINYILVKIILMQINFMKYKEIKMNITCKINNEYIFDLLSWDGSVFRGDPSLILETSDLITV